MTKRFNQRVRCQSCGEATTLESPFERWFRAQPELQSKEGFVRFDLDVLIHRYKWHEDGWGSLEIQHMMFVEVKTNMAKPSPAQADTLYVLNQVLRNRRPNRHKRHRLQVAGQLTNVWSLMLDRRVKLMAWGGHLLQLSGTSPDTSDEMRWDKKPIDYETLIGVLTFRLNPDDPTRKTDIRRGTGAPPRTLWQGG